VPRPVDPDAKFDGALRIVGATDPAAIRAILEELPEARWHEHTFRQEAAPEATHKDTHTIFVKYRAQGNDIVDEPLLARLRPILGLFRRTFRTYYGITRAPIHRVIFTRLAPHSAIPRHRDSGPFLESHRRIHIPIVTHPDIQFLAGDRWQHLTAGTMYELNNQRAHAVRNPTDLQRIHMIVDIKTDGAR
jgi:hypothetical protein